MIVRSLARNLSPTTAARMTAESRSTKIYQEKANVNATLLKVAEVKVENPSTKFLDPVITVEFMPSPTNMILTFSLGISTFSLYIPAFILITYRFTLMFGAILTASPMVR